MSSGRHMRAQLVAMILAAGVIIEAPAAQTPSSSPRDAYIVLLKDGVSPRSVAAAHGLKPAFIYRTAVNGLAGLIPPGRLRALEGDPNVLAVIPDRPVFAIGKPDKPGGGKGGRTKGQVVPAGVDRIGAAPGSLPFTGTGIGVAVVDTGLDSGHQDLPVGAHSFSAFGGSAQDDNGHGTHVGGTIAALDNAVDVVGVAPGSTLYAVKVLDARGEGMDSHVIAGLNWIAGAEVQPPIRVVNISLGRPGTLGDNPALRQAVQSLHGQGISIVVAAGNDCDMEVSQMVPATYPEVMAVASTTALDGKNGCRFFSGTIAADTASYFTTDGAFDPMTGIGVTISAPGEDNENINGGCLIKPVGILSTKLGGGTTRMWGTSMAAPHVAGVVALIWECSGGAAPEDVRSVIMSTARWQDAAPLDSPASCYTSDGVREGILWAPGALESCLEP